MNNNPFTRYFNKMKKEKRPITVDDDRIHVHILPTVKYKREYLDLRVFS